MEDCVRMVCEILGVHTGDEVSAEKISELYQRVFHISTELQDTQRAVTQVSAQNGGLLCSGRWILHVLLEMEKEREKREKLYWELQMLKSNQSCVSDEANTQPLYSDSSREHNTKQDTKPCGLLSMLRRARRLHVRLDVDSVWSVLSSLSLSHMTSRRLGLINPSKSDVLLLLQYKYDIIRERLYREMLQEEHGAGWWESMDPWEQTDCVCDVEQRAEEAFRLNDVLRVCELPGVLHCYSSNAEVRLHSCPDEAREQAWTSSPRGHSWTSAIVVSELRSHCEEETRVLAQLLDRVERLIRTEIYLSVCVSVRRAERETHSHAALLSSRQHWDNWPCTTRLCVEDLVKFWLQEKRDPDAHLGTESRTSCCVRQQALLQCLVLCQEQERRTLVEILHSVSQEELQEQRHTITPDYKAAGTTDSALRRGCVSVLRKMKSSLCSSTHSSVSWADCAVHLLTQLTHTHDQEVQTVVHTLPVMDAAALLVLLKKYELELRSPKLHNLHNLLNTHINTSVTDGAWAEQRRSSPSVTEEQEVCTGCGVVLVPEDAPYLEILGVGQQREEEERREGGDREEEERGEGKEGDGSDRGEERKREGEGEDEREKADRREERGRREGGEEEERTEAEEEERSERGEEKKRERRDGEDERNVDAIEKQGSLIALAWSKPVNIDTQDAQNECSSDEGGATSAGLETHTPDAVCEGVCEEQQLQRDATMRSLVDIQRRAEQRWQRDRDRQILRVQERLSIIQNRKSDEDLLGPRHQDTFRHLTNTLQQEDEQQQKVLVREKLQELWRERSYILQSRRERNKAEFKELLTPTAQRAANTEDVLHTPAHTHQHT